ncbi:MAG: uroporphyrinogen-III synthase [Proteobacteria bacterium]|nr:uroporphyrinogen-III synthase [Pseudomonadota bacterium]
MSSLNGAGVLITRPGHQSAELARLVEKAGGVPVLFPAIEIEPAASASELLSRFHALSRPDLAIVISSNAANYGEPVLATIIDQDIQLAAIGPATAKTMKHLGCRPGIVPASGFNSEALLAESEFRDMAERRVLILRAQGGRELLGDTLRQRGATVDYLEVYRRILPQPSSGEVEKIESLWTQGGIRFVAANSVETLDNLVRLLTQDGQRLLRASRIVTISERVVRKAEQIGIAAPALLAGSPTDQAMLDIMFD